MNSTEKAVFLSYASEDAEAAARVREGLEAAGIEVWFDQTRLKGGDAWDAAIRRRIKECALFIPIVSAATDARDEGYFRLEWKLAVDRSHLIADDRAFLLPASLDATTQQAARVPDRFRDVQWSRVSRTEEIAAFAQHVLALLAGATPAPAAPAATSRSETIATRGTPSIAVLPFVNMSRDEENEYFADGLSEELLNMLARIRGLRVASRTSAFAYKGKEVALGTIARQLGVATVLEGSVRKAGKRIRITAQLIEASSDSHLWSQAYDRDLDDIFAVQDDIAEAVVTQLRRALLREEEGARDGGCVRAEVSAAATGRTADAEAHRLFLQARFFGGRATRADTERALEFFRQAIERDPDFASGWTGVSTMCWSQAQHGWVAPAEGFRRSREAAERALELDPGLPEAHVCLSRVLDAEWDWDGASARLERALALAPGDAQVLRALSRHVGYLGRLDESIEYSRRAVVLDPLNFAGHFNLAGRYSYAGRFEEAEASLRRAADVNPAGGAVNAGLAITRLLQGRPQEALEAGRKEVIDASRLVVVAMAEHALGHGPRSDEALAELTAGHGGSSAYNIAMVFAWRDEPERAFEWLERAYAQKDIGLADLLIDPFLGKLRKDPRWLAMVRRVGLPESGATDRGEPGSAAPTPGQ